MVDMLWNYGWMYCFLSASLRCLMSADSAGVHHPLPGRGSGGATMLYTTVIEAIHPSPSQQLREQSRGESKPSMLCLTRIAEPLCISSLELIRYCVPHSNACVAHTSVVQQRHMVLMG
ncbi:hypothetical protein E2C01_035037 [Portunus trituberculatus]|uniref:Secreted protein n=1 Tax=Portunus trituberculatus TaxID=210409 RepID=A0A5B7F815_PORTR|nr:hypothetical protein [Portunus trituberculatus]